MVSDIYVIKRLFYLMKGFLQCIIIGASVLPAHVLAEDSDHEGVNYLILAWGNLNYYCRGTSPRDSIEEQVMWESCQARQNVMVMLNKLGWCYGRPGEAGAQMTWHKCEYSE